MDYRNKINSSHNHALEWFLDNSGKVISWTGALDDGTFLFTKAKGIYKPKDSQYALSIRHAPKTHYQDDEPIFNLDGSWFYNYHQEEVPSKPPEELYTNQGLLACMRDAVPVGVAIKISEKPNVRYKILGLANVIGLNNGKFKLTSFEPKGQHHDNMEYGPYTPLINKLNEPEFIPNSSNDARTKVLREIVQRQGQKKFRDSLLKIYDEACVITGCKVKSVLEAAHITPYLGSNTNHPSNGLLLRADIHTLWDLGLIAIEPLRMQVRIDEKLKGSEYERYQNQVLKFNLHQEYYPSKAALQQQLDLFNSEKNNYG
jgi:hypothetical protein